jgi:hypothetical protein
LYCISSLRFWVGWSLRDDTDPHCPPSAGSAGKASIGRLAAEPAEGGQGGEWPVAFGDVPKGPANTSDGAKRSNGI